MGVRAITVGGLLGFVFACTLPVDEKTSCRTSQDCVDARVCVEATCRDDACGALCSAICEAADDCADPVASCEERCLAGEDAAAPFLPTLDGRQCAAAFDAWSTAERCDATDCVLSCASVCAYAKSPCGLVVDDASCVVGCLQLVEDCPAAMPTNCVDVPTDVLCWEDDDACQ